MFKYNKFCSFNSLISILHETEILDQLLEGGVIVLDTVHSTNQYIIDNLKYIKSGDVFVTEYQTQGRGRRGNYWITPHGQSISLSIYWKLNRKLLTTIELSLIVSATVAKVLKGLGVSHIQIKWPNDLYVNNRKLAGILIEIVTKNSSISHVIIGIGINISICMHTRSSIKMSKDWIGLKSIGINPNRNMLVAILTNALRWILKKFECNKYILPFVYNQKSLNFLYNKQVLLFINNDIENGTVLGIRSDGSLLVIDSLGIIHSYLQENISVRLLSEDIG